MLIKINSDVSDAVNASSLVKKYNTKIKNIKKSPSLHSGSDLIIVFERKNKSFPFLDEKLLEGLIKANTPFVFTNEVFYKICNEWEKLNIKWETIALFITDVLNCKAGKSQKKQLSGKHEVCF